MASATSFLDRLPAVLEQELAAVRTVLECLSRESSALRSRAADGLLAASNAKADAVAEAARLEQERRDLLAAHPDAHQLEMPRFLAELRGLAAECRKLNEANGLMIRGQRRRIEGSLNVLRGGRASADVYGPGGETYFARQNRLPLASY